MRLLTYLILIALLPGCGEVSYKRGGSQQDIERAHQTCRGSGEQLSNCLSEQGWHKPTADAFDPLFATIKSSDNREAMQTKPSPFINIKADDSQKKIESNVVKTPQAAASANQPETAATASAQSSTDDAASHSTVNDGPDVEYSINSWWKMGAFPNQLKRDQETCEKKLGPDYMPDYKTQTYKRAFVACMHELDWMAVRNMK